MSIVVNDSDFNIFVDIIAMLNIATRGGTRVHSQLPNECDHLPRVLEFMAIIFVIIEISSALWTQKI